MTIEQPSVSLEEIAQAVIAESNGSFYIEWGEEFEQLNSADQQRVEDLVYREISPCECCGWHWHVDDLETVNHELVCWKCASDIEQEETDDED